eukprot:7391489-Prymnesium_polylepis.2
MKDLNGLGHLGNLGENRKPQQCDNERDQEVGGRRHRALRAHTEGIRISLIALGTKRAALDVAISTSLRSHTRSRDHCSTDTIAVRPWAAFKPSAGIKVSQLPGTISPDELTKTNICDGHQHCPRANRAFWASLACPIYKVEALNAQTLLRDEGKTIRDLAKPVGNFKHPWLAGGAGQGAVKELQHVA